MDADTIQNGASGTQTALIARWRDNVLDLDMVVDDKRQAVDRAVEELRQAVRDRDHGALYLARLIELYDETALVESLDG